MLKQNRTIHFFGLVLLALVLSPANTGLALDSPGELFLPSDQALTDVERAMQRAGDQEQLALVILGANWCHDSRALAARIHEEPLATLIKEHYQVVLVDVAYLDKGREVISHIGPPVYYATPTVLIVDPVSGVMVNADNRHQWGNAANISMEESVAYFQLMANVDLASLREENPSSALVQGAMAEIDGFEQMQAERLYQAYGVLGPLLKAYKAGEEPENFKAYWNEVRFFRMSVARDVDRLRAEAETQALARNEEIFLEFPEYPEFSWEVQD